MPNWQLDLKNFDYSLPGQDSATFRHRNDLFSGQSLFTADTTPATGTSYQTIPHHRTCATFRESVKDGCYVCNRLWATLVPDEKRHILGQGDLVPPESSSDDTRSDTDRSAAAGSAKAITAASLEDGRSYGHSGCYVLGLSVSLSRVLPPGSVPGRTLWRSHLLVQPRDGSAVRKPGLSPYTKSIETFSLARAWITDCAENHYQCNAVRRDSPWYPTRLLDCSLSGEPTSFWRIVESRITNIDEPYMTLSHCWGRADCLKLTTDNYDQLINGVPMSILPELYRDAVYAASQLGFRYLWIDSLCIIQQGDDQADWHREVTLMADVYSNSFCNISAAVAPDANHSMFHFRDPEALSPGIAVGVSADGRETPYLISDLRLWEVDISRALVNTRAWVLQERLLSPRVLHFGASQVFWECREKDAAEVYPGGVPTDLFPPQKRCKNFAPDPSGENHASDRQASGDLWAYQAWARIVRAYTACTLTFPGDKLVAIHAVAKVIQPVLRDEYVAGMWRRFMERELLWSVVHRPSNTASRTRTYRAPSWSWAAVDGEVNTGVLEVDPEDVLINVEDVHLDYSQDDDTGSISGGWMRLRGMLKQLMLEPYSRRDWTNHREWTMVVNGVHVSVLTDSAIREPQPHVMLDEYHTNFDVENAEGTLYCMPCRKRKDVNGSIYVLLLMLEDRERGIFRRIGLAHGWAKAVRERILDRSGEEDKFPSEEYRDGWHTIRVI